MPNKSIQKRTPKKQNRNRKYSEHQPRRYHQKPQSWKCRICLTEHQNSQQFCVACFIDLHYYSYVNMHMFVQSDNSYQSRYYNVKNVESDCGSVCSTEVDSQVEEGKINVDWVEGILVDE